MAHRFRKSAGPTRLGKKARALIRWSLEANLVMLGTAAAITIALSLLLLILPTSELHAQTNSAPSVSRVSPSSPVSLTTGGSQTFQVSATDADNNLTKWEWEVDKHLSFLHGHQEPEETFTATGSITKSFSHTFPDNGTYTVTVTFTDSDGESGTAEWRAEVEDPPNRAPSVSKESPIYSWEILATGDSLTFEASASDPDDNLKSYEWTVDGTSEDAGSWLILPTGSVTKSFTRTFSTSGEYMVEVTFTDDEGLSDSVSWTITAVDPITIQIDAAEYTVNEDDGEVEITVTLSASPPEYVSVLFRTRDGTATSPRDYRSSVVIERFSRDTTALTQTFPVTIRDDYTVEPTESFRVGVSLGVGSRLLSYVSLTRSEATVKILDDDEATVAFTENMLSFSEDRGTFEIGVEVETDPSTRCEVALPFDVHFSYTDPDGALSSSSTIPSSMTFGECGSRRVFLADLADVTGNAEVVFTLDSVTSADSGLASRVKIGEPSTVTLTVIDDDQPVGNRPPTVSRVSPTSSSLTLTTGDSRTFTARATDPDSNITSYEWTVNGRGVGNSGTLTDTGDVSQTFTHTFASPGTHTVKATFTDDEGASGSVSWTVGVGDSTEPANRAPSVSRVSPTSSSLTLTTGDSRTFTASATDADSNITSYEWTVNGRGVGNSGTLPDTGDVSQTFTHPFSSSGTYPVKVEFTDAEGATGSASWSVNVQEPRPDPPPPPPTSNSAPTVTIASPVSPVRLETGETRTFTARSTDDDKNLTKWKWVVDKHDSPFDGHQEPEASFASTGRILKSFRHTFPDDGTYTVTVTFTDSSGESDSDKWRVEVEDPPWVDDKSVTHTCGTEPATPKAGGEFTIVSEVTAGEDLEDMFVRFDFSDAVRGLYDRARAPENSSMDISAGDTVRLTAPGIVSHGGDGWVLRCTVMREPGFLEGYINNNPRQLAVEEKAITISPYSQNSKESGVGKLKSCGYIATENEGGKLGAKFIRGSRNIHREYRVNAYLYEGGERVWEGSAHKDAVASTSTQTEFTLTFTGEPELEGKYRLDCELTTKYYFNEPTIAFLLRIPTCVTDPFTFTLCAVVLAYELSTQWELIDSASSTFCVGGYPDCPFTYDTESNISPPSVRVGEPVSLSFRTNGLNGVADHGGVTVSFPDLTGVGTTSPDYEYVSDKASVSTVSYTTGTSNVTYHRTGASVQTEGGTPGTANYLLVESDDSSWPSGADRTLELEVTPWEPGTFRVQYRYWLCLAGYDDCRRKPESGGPDQQGWQVDVLEITVNAVPDRDELVEFYEDTDGPNWDDAAAWLSHAPLDDWHGVDTDTGSDGRVTVLELPSNSLSGAIPTVVGDLTGLEVLDLSGNGLTGEISAALESLTALRTLDLSGNGLTGEIPAALESLTALRTLDLSGNGLTGEIPSDLGDLTALTTLDLSANDLGGGIPSDLGKLTNLQVLYLASNNLNRPIPVELGNLTNLTELDLSGNGLSGSIPAELDKLANLQVLDLSGNRRLTGAIPEGLGNLEHLDAVYLDGNNLNSGCIPATWRDVYNHDLDDIGLPFCDVALSALAVSPGELTPRFDPAVSKYTAKVEDGQVTITPATSHGSAFQLLDGEGESVPDADGALGGHQIAVGYGDTTIKIRVVSPDGGDRHTYTVRVVWAGEPRVPAIAGITPGPSSLEVSWVMPTDIRDDYITSYHLRHIQSSAPDQADSNWTVLGDVWTSGPLSHTVMGLHAGTGYDVQLRAVTSAGVSPWSATVNGTPAEGECSTEGAVPDPVNNPGQAADCEALLEVRDALSGDGDLDWESSDPVSGWDGAEVDPATGRITRLDLDGEVQPGVAPSVRAGLTRQQTAASSKDPLTGEIPAALSSLTGLEHLSLAHNQLTGRIPRELARLTELQALRLQGNQLTGRIPAELAGLSNLVELKLGQNRLTGCVPEGLLDVADNDLGQLGLPTCGPAVVMSVATTSIAVRTGTPIAVTATFDEPVTGFAVGDVSVVNGSAGNFSGSDGDTVYTFDVVPDAIGAVTVDIAADAAEESGGNGNRAAPRLWLGMPYDDDGDGVIEKSEVIEAINDYLFGEGDEAISKSDVIKLINLYLFG